MSGLVPTGLGPIFVADSGRADRGTALLWPSLFTDHRMWDEQVALMNRQGWRTLALDPPSHGASRGVERPFSMDACADAAVSVLEALGVDEPVVALGTSWGGFVAPRIALRAPERIKGLVLFATSADPPLLAQKLKATALATLFPISAADGFVDRVNLSHLLSPKTLRERPGLGAHIQSGYRAWDRKRLLVAIRSVLLKRTSLIGDLRRVDAPALVVSGSQDELLPPALGRRMAARLPRARFVQVEGAAHLIPLEQPQVTNDLILEFLGTRAG